MHKYYNPSKDEVKAIEKVREQLSLIAKKTLNVKNPNVQFNHSNGSHYERIHNGEISVSIYDIDIKKYDIKIVAKNGLLIYYKYDGKTFYIVKLKEMVSHTQILKKGRWTTIEEKQYFNDGKKRNKVREEDCYTPISSFPKPEPKKIEEESYWDSKYYRYLQRYAYCEQFRETFGRESSEVSDEFYLFGDN